jgi:hypothetical protein
MGVQNTGFRRGATRWLADFSVALCLFWFGVLAFGGAQNHAHAIPLSAGAAATADRASALGLHTWGRAAQTELRVLRESREDHTRTLILLSLAFAGLASCNLAFLRHLRRAYASPRRSVWRRG